MTVLHRLTGTDWVKELVIPLAIVFMKACWIYPWLAWLGTWTSMELQRPPLSLASVIVLGGVPLFATRLLSGRDWGPRRSGFTLAAILLVTFFAVVRIEYRAGFGLAEAEWFGYFGRTLIGSFHELNTLIMAMFAGAYLLWWGIRWGSSSLSFSRTYRAFLTGLIALVLIIIVNAAGTGDTSTGIYAAGFFFCGLAALALGNREVYRKKAARDRSGGGPGGRFPLLLGVIAGIVLLGVILASFSSDAGFWVTLTQWLKTAGDWLFDNIIYYVLIGISYVVAWIFQILKFLFNVLFQPPEFDPQAAVGEATPEPTPATVTPTTVFSPELILVLKWGCLALLAAAAVFLLVKAYRNRAAARDGDGVEETRESLWSWDLFSSDLRLFLLMLWHKLKRPKAAAAHREAVPSWYAAEETPYLYDIREIYRHLLWEAAVAGIDRRRHETTEEYTRRLVQFAPESAGQLDEINRLYARTRYGDEPPPQPQLDLANRLWQGLRRYLRSLREA